MIAGAEQLSIKSDHELLSCLLSIGHNSKWDHFDILAKGRSETHCRIKETLLIRELKTTLNDIVRREKLYPYYACKVFSASVIVTVN